MSFFLLLAKKKKNMLLFKNNAFYYGKSPLHTAKALSCTVLFSYNSFAEYFIPCLKDA